MRNTRSTQPVITSDKVGFKKFSSTTQKFCGKEEDKHSFPGQRVTAFTTCCACSWCNLSSACSFRTRQQARWRSWSCGGCPFLSVSYPWFPRTNVLGEGNRHSSGSHLVTLVFSLRESSRSVGQRCWAHSISGVEMAKLNELEHQTMLKHRLCSGTHNVYAYCFTIFPLHSSVLLAQVALASSYPSSFVVFNVVSIPQALPLSSSFLTLPNSSLLLTLLTKSSSLQNL